jgi:hypothetical protein
MRLDSLESEFFGDDSRSIEVYLLVDVGHDATRHQFLDDVDWANVHARCQLAHRDVIGNFDSILRLGFSHFRSSSFCNTLAFGRWLAEVRGNLLHMVIGPYTQTRRKQKRCHLRVGHVSPATKPHSGAALPTTDHRQSSVDGASQNSRRGLQGVFVLCRRSVRGELLKIFPTQVRLQCPFQDVSS